MKVLQSFLEKILVILLVFQSLSSPPSVDYQPLQVQAVVECYWFEESGQLLASSPVEPKTVVVWLLPVVFDKSLVGLQDKPSQNHLVHPDPEQLKCLVLDFLPAVVAATALVPVSAEGKQKMSLLLQAIKLRVKNQTAG